MAIRIMHIIPNSQNLGGLERGLLNLLHRIDPNRFEHAVCAVGTLGPLGELLPSDRVLRLSLEKTDRRMAVHLGALKQRIREIKPDVVHSRNWGAVEAVMAGRWSGSCALVHSEHGIDISVSESEPARRRWLRRVAFEMADCVFTVSHQLRDLHSRRTGFPARKIHVIHNGVDTRRLFPDSSARARTRSELGIAESEFCVGAIGRMDPIKDYRTLIEAADRFSQYGRRLKLLIVGEGPDLSALEQFASARPNLNGRVRFIGVTRNVPEILNALDVYVLPSISEGISNSLLEAMATQLPVIATATGGNPEVIVDSTSGLLFPVRDVEKLSQHLVLLHDDVQVRNRLGAEALRRVKQHFSIDSMVQKYEELYASVVHARSAHAQTA
jgi:sugar transferase (PEP-CTERM/EpsH1 system associated)